MTRTLAPAALALLTSLACAQDLTHSAPAQDHPIFITGATVHTVSGDTIPNGVVGFNEGTITVVGRADQVMPRIMLSPDTEIIDASGKHLYPAIIAADTQLGLTEVGAVRSTHDYDEVGAFTPEARAAVAVNPDSTLIPVTRSNGVLLFAALPTGGRMPGRASVMRADGWTWEDMAVLDDAALVVNWPSVRARYRAFPGKNDNDADDIRKNIDAIDDFFDAAEAYHAARAADPGAPRDARLDALAAYLPGANDQRPLMIGANDIDAITSAVTWAAGRGLRVALLGGRDAPMCADLLREHDVSIIVRGTHAWPKRDDSPHDDPFTLPKRLEDAGLAWCLAPSERNGNERNLPYEAARAAAFGLDPAPALRSITLSPAEILGIADRYGSIDRGKSATFFVANGDCLEITSNVELAFIDGRRIDLSNKQTKLRDKYRDKYKQLGIITDN